MSKNVDCDVFQDQLDALKRGALSQEGAAQLRLHAATCSECGVLLQVHEHLAVASLRELEAQVPDLYVASMWDRVQTEIAAGGPRRSRSGGGQPARWLVPTLVAASALLLVSSSFLLAELGKARGREQALVLAVESHERRLAELEAAALPRTSGLGLAGRRAWERALAGKQSVTLGELMELLAKLPAGTTLLDAPRLRAFGDLGWAVSGWREALSEIEVEDGAQAGELLRALRALQLDPETPIPVDRLLAVRRGDPRSGRS